MLTRFGKFCRKLRIDNGKLLFDMAQQLGVSSAFLSKVENGKAKPPIEWERMITDNYNLAEEQMVELRASINEARRNDVISIADMPTDDKDMMLAFARKLDTMDPENKEKIKRLLGY
jgi:transcriptional regulator with XRE-family HTH domain